MRHYFLGLFIALSSFYGFGQAGSIYLEANYNTFSHSSLKNFQEEFVNDIPEIPVQVNDNFPGNLGFTLGYKVNSINGSFFFGYTTTGGKISYSDFSGVVRIIQPLKGYTIGGDYQIPLLKDKKSNLNLAFRGLITLSDFEVKTYERLLDNFAENSLGFRSIDYGVGVNLIYEYPIWFFSLRASLGADMVLGGKLIFDDDNELYLEDNSGDKVKTGWTGFRSGIGVSIPL